MTASSALRPSSPSAPATAVFYRYSQELFEGLKAYRADSGSMAVFRPQANAARFNAGCRRMAMPELPEETFLRALQFLARRTGLDPGRRGQQPLPPPFMIATERGLSVNHPSGVPVLRDRLLQQAGLLSTNSAVKVWLSAGPPARPPAARATSVQQQPAAFAAQQQAVRRAATRWCGWTPPSRSWVEEIGSMEPILVYGSGSSASVMTPTLTGWLLPGITRDSLLRLAPALGVPAAEDASRSPPGGTRFARPVR